MCGISGIIGGKGGKAPVQRMMGDMVHRGPDASGLHVFENGYLGHRRLSIMDPQGGDQPLYNEDRSLAIVANGEIYNHPALRKDLEGRHSFETTSDTETVLHLYEEKGPEMVEMLDGMFAIAIVQDTEIFLARDAIGIKPLYYGEVDGAFFFASELRALSGCCRDIKEFPAGTWYHSQKGFNSFYTVPDIPPVSRSEAEHIRSVRETLDAAVEKRLMSDVPLGAFLSGGLDSSAIVALAQQKLDQPMHTFSVGIDASPDTLAARKVSQHCGTLHHEYTLTIEEILDSLPLIIRSLESFDQDLVRSAIPCHFTSRLAAQYVKVILTGEGADELFAGYTYYKDIPDATAYLQAELRRSVAKLHNINLQRVDRLTMAHSIEGRVPFLDLKMIEAAQRVPVELKLKGEPPVEKWVLRKAVEDLLPDEIVWREKAQFDEGSGTVDALDQALSGQMSEEETERYRAEHPQVHLRSPEECFYHRLFMEAFEMPHPILANVGRWSDRPEWGE